MTPDRILHLWRLPAALAAASLALAAMGPEATAALRWERELLGDEPWRILTAHLMHLDFLHLALNLAGLAALWALIGQEWRQVEWVVFTLFVASVIGIGLMLVPGLDWYLGLSGLLHGLFAAGGVGMARHWRMGASIIFLFLLGKAVFEILHPGEAVVQAHWLGAAAGAVAGIIAGLWRRRAE